MKNYRYSVIAVLVFIVLIIAVFFLKPKIYDPIEDNSINKLKDAAKPIVNIQPTGEKIIDFNINNIDNIRINNTDGIFVFNRNENKEWQLIEPKGLKYTPGVLNSFAEYISRLDAIKVVEENTSNFKQYGLNGSYMIHVGMKVGTELIIEIGDKTPTGDNYYVRNHNSSKIYTISSYLGGILKLMKNDFRDRAIYPFNTDFIYSYKLIKEGKDVFSAKKQESGEWRITNPIEKGINMGKFKNLLESLTQTSISKFVEQNPTSLSKYGLDKPAYIIEADTVSGKVVLYIGKESETETEAFAKLGSDNEVFTVPLIKFNYLDTPGDELVRLVN